MRRIIFSLIGLLISSNALSNAYTYPDSACFNEEADAAVYCAVAWTSQNPAYYWEVNGSGQGYCRTQFALISSFTNGGSCSACPEGEVRSTETGLCEPPPDPCEGAPDGAAYDPQLEACVCPAGQTDYLDTQGGYSCVEDVPECTPSSSNFTGAWVNNVPICSYDGDCGEGQTGGVVDTGDGPNWICVNEPNCSGTWINGSCISPNDTTPEPDTQTDKDTDGDGIPDSSDGDIDGDGIPNSTDDDIDGDGVLNVDDQSNEKESSVSGGGSCEVAPTCQGDAIQCAQLQQQWLTRCKGDGSYEETNCSVAPVCNGDPLQCQALLNDWEYECATQTAADDAESEYQSAGLKTADDYAAEGGVFGDGESHDIDAVAGDVLASRSAIAGSCPSPKQLDLGVFGTTEITFQAFCDLADMIYWIVMLSAYLTATFILFRSITN